MDINRQHKQRKSGSLLSRGFRDLGTHQGLTLFKAIMICAILSITLDIIGKRLGIGTDLLYPVIIAINVIIFVVIVIRMTSISKRTIDQKREKYRQKLEEKNK